MPTYTVDLTEDQQMALDYEVERQNLMPQPIPPGDPAPPPLTAQAALARHVTQWLDMTGEQLKGTLDPLMTMVESAPPEMRSALIAGVQQPYARSYLTRKYGGMA